MREGGREPHAREGRGRNRPQMLPRDEPHKRPSGQGRRGRVWDSLGVEGEGKEENRVYADGKLFQPLPCTTGSEFLSP